MFLNKVAGTVHVHPLKINIYTLALISFKPFAFAKLNVTCNYKKLLIFNGRLRKTRYDFLTKKLRQFLFLVCCNCPKACLKLEVNKTQTFITPCLSSLYGGHYVKSKIKFYAHSIRITLNEESHNLQFLAPEWKRQYFQHLENTRGVLCFISKRNIECFVK